ncbi:ABC transporter ATP-binding protein [Streptomyces sp. SID9124]|uniref:ABC transporter ATP-binding protein n=1 Tax=Streptomyces sp. SID9124 TaxID=2706108 RepID=UPI0013DFB31C|nr:ABC transporter ATP-binding protein [Streptomyces sp. SID9124]NED13060.1 ABC transporter ATP-binding protein [Streptomyces sp. SID9124]
MKAPATGKAPLDTWTVLRRMGVRFRPYLWQSAVSFLMVVLTVALSTATPLLLRGIIDDALPNGDIALLTELCCLMVAAGLLASLLVVAQTALTNWIGQRVSARLRIEVYDRARAQRLRFYSEEGHTQIQARLISDIDAVDRFLTGTVQQGLSTVLSLLMIGSTMIVLNWRLALICGALATVLSLFNNRFARRRRGLARQRQQLLTTVLRYVAEDLSLSGILLGRTMRRTERQRQRFIEVTEAIRETTFRQRIVGISAHVVIGASFACLPPLVYLACGLFAAHLSVGAVVVLVTLQQRLAQQIQDLLRLSGSLQTSVAMFERVLEYVDMEIADDDRTIREAAGGPPARVRLRGVRHRYPGAAAPSLDGIDVDFPAGSVTVVAGSTGSGKSTLGLVMAGLLPCDAGSVDMGGEPGPGSLRSAVTLIPQHTGLLHGTIRDNLLFARDGVPDEELERVLAVVGLDTVVAALPDGLDTSIGADGLQLSGGERQRLGIARAMLVDCRMLIADEVTSALDPRTAERITLALREHCRDKTLVLIAHRLPALAPDDRVVVLEHGRVAEAGRHGDLSSAGGTYAALRAAEERATELTGRR